MSLFETFVKVFQRIFKGPTEIPQQRRISKRPAVRSSRKNFRQSSAKSAVRKSVARRSGISRSRLILQRPKKKARQISGGNKPARRLKTHAPPRAAGARKAVSAAFGQKDGVPPPARSHAPAEVYLGDVTHYFSKIKVCVVKISGQPIAVGDEIAVKGNGTNFKQHVESLQIESNDVRRAPQGKLVGLKVKQVTNVGDKVYKVS